MIFENVIPNLREMNCSVIGNCNYTETSLLEEPKNWETFLDFNEKYIVGNKGQSKKQIGVTLENNLDEKIKTLSVQVFKLLGCCGVVRIDYLLNGETKELFVNEINTTPGSFANYLWKHKYSFSELLDKLIELACEEYIYKNKYKYAYKSDVLKMYDNTKKLGIRKVSKL